MQASRALDQLEEQELVPQRKVLYQFSARGHDMAQVLLGLAAQGIGDGVCGYYRSRPLLLSLGVRARRRARARPWAARAAIPTAAISASCSTIRIPTAPRALPMCGGVGAQYTPTAGWAQAIDYKHDVLKDGAYAMRIAVVLGGDASCATNGFWSALTIATTQKLPMLFYIEDNGYGISVPSSYQTPGEDIAANLASFAGLHDLQRRRHRSGRSGAR